MRALRMGVILGVVFTAACGDADTVGEDSAVDLTQGIENTALANAEVRELSNSNALATLYRVHDRTIERGELARERASSAPVRQLAQQMLDARANLMLDATATAQRLGVDFTTALDSIPTTTVTSELAEAHAEALAQLRGTTGAEFDTAWLRVERGVAQESIGRLGTFDDPTMDSTVFRLVGESRAILQREATQIGQLLGGA